MKLNHDPWKASFCLLALSRHILVDIKSRRRKNYLRYRPALDLRSSSRHILACIKLPPPYMSVSNAAHSVKRQGRLLNGDTISSHKSHYFNGSLA